MSAPSAARIPGASTHGPHGAPNLGRGGFFAGPGQGPGPECSCFREIFLPYVGRDPGSPSLLGCPRDVAGPCRAGAVIPPLAQGPGRTNRQVHEGAAQGAAVVAARRHLGGSSKRRARMWYAPQKVGPSASRASFTTRRTSVRGSRSCRFFVAGRGRAHSVFRRGGNEARALLFRLPGKSSRFGIEVGPPRRKKILRGGRLPVAVRTRGGGGLGKPRRHDRDTARTAKERIATSGTRTRRSGRSTGDQFHGREEEKKKKKERETAMKDQ